MGGLKILYITTALGTGGAEVLLYHLLAHGDRRRFEPAVISLGAAGRVGAMIEGLGVPVHVLGMPAGRPTPRGAARLAGLVRRMRPDLVQGWMYHGNLAASLGAALCGAPAVWCVHKSVSSLRDEKPGTAAVIRLGAALSRHPARIVYVSEAGRAQHEAMGYRAEKGVVIANGVDPGLFRPSDEARAEVRAELGLAPGAPLIGLFARRHPQKDHGTFLRAAALLARSRPEARFLLAGTGVDAASLELACLVAELGLGGRALLLGERADVARLTAALDLATSSSAFGEGLSLAIAEAMAAGVPCVVTAVGDSPALVGDTGRVVGPRDPAGLAAAWGELLDAGPAVRRALGRAARARVVERYGVGATARRYEELYLGALGGQPTAAGAPGEARSR